MVLQQGAPASLFGGVAELVSVWYFQRQDTDLWSAVFSTTYIASAYEHVVVGILTQYFIGKCKLSKCFGLGAVSSQPTLIILLRRSFWSA